MKRIIFLLSLAVLSSCSSFKSKDDLLTSKEWILEMECIRDLKNGTDSLVNHYPEHEKMIRIKFDKNNAVRYYEYSAEQQSSWDWTNKEENQLNITDGFLQGKWSILTLNERELTMHMPIPWVMESNTLKFLHAGDPGWLTYDKIRLLESK